MSYPHAKMILSLHSLLLCCVLSVFGQFENQIQCPIEESKDEFWNDTVVDYYVNLIRTDVAEAAAYQPPKNNNYFLQDSDCELGLLNFEEYDFIIVGAGTSGSTLAYSLSEREDWNILLIEAGGNETDFSEIPAFYAYLQSSPMDWGYATTPQEHACGGLGATGCIYPRGKVEGGSGATNGLMYVRGNEANYNDWLLKGNPGWSYNDVLPYFIKQEHSKIDGDPGYHGINGLLNVEYAQPENPLVRVFLNANEAAGNKIVDYNGVRQLGAARVQFTTVNGRRESGRHVYLSRAKCRKNLHILKKALATKILVDGCKKAYGVEFVKCGQNYTVTSRKEIIISGGSINTPQLLLLSGIGPKNELTELGIEVVDDLPGVGRNLQDHPISILGFATNLTTSNISTEELAKMYLAGLGPYTRAASIEATSFFRIESSNLPAGVPDIQLLFLTSLGFGTPWLAWYPPNSFVILVYLLHPKSRGSVTLTSNNPLDFPAIDPKFLYEEEDREVLYRGIEATIALVETEPFRRINATLAPMSIPECDGYEFRSREYWVCNMKYYSNTGYHPTSTAAMGLGLNAVVDYRLRVHGIGNLRVVDCSVMPDVTSGNTNAPAFMIGLKASDIIKQDHFLI